MEDSIGIEQFPKRQRRPVIVKPDTVFIATKSTKRIFRRTRQNKRIKKKKEQQRLAWTIRELVAEAQSEEERKQALVRRFADFGDRSWRGLGYLGRD